MSIDVGRLHDIVVELSRRPGHEKVRALVYDLLVDGLGARSEEVDFERPLPEVRGRVDALLGETVFEFKRDLRRERADAEEELTRYLADRERETSRRFIGIATDGAEFAPYELRRNRLTRLPGFTLTRDRGSDLLAWLDTAVSIRPELDPTPELVRRELGRDSLAYERARARLEALWQEVAERPDVELRRRLWSDLLARVYGEPVDEASFFFQHTYLTIVAKTMATRILGVPLPGAADLLSGAAFAEAGIRGAVESDFFDWVLDAPGGSEVVERIARQVDRFRLADVEADVLKGLYESLIDPTQRHDLGEYYTPDWLAARVCDRAIGDALRQRVIDPACGSGTFLFHAVRRFLAAADRAGLSGSEAVAQCTSAVLGIDVHPVAVIIARVTYLLAIGEARLRQRPSIALPVYLGDSLQWNTRTFLAEREVLLDVPDAEPLYFPFAVTRDPSRFDAVVDAMLHFSTEAAGADAFMAWLDRQGITDPTDQQALGKTYSTIRDLQAAGRNHIWGYVARNQSRPIWLSTEDQRADVVVGNPPWLAYRSMSRDMQVRFRDECRARGIWAGGKVATHQDLSGYFFARSVELYLKPGGTIAFVMPYAALSRRQFAGFRSGRFGPEYGSVRFLEAWAFDEHVQPLFPVPSCVIIAEVTGPGALPLLVTGHAGILPRRDATEAEAAATLEAWDAPWPESGENEDAVYRSAFRQGATLVPRMLCIVEQVPIGRLGGDPDAPLVESRRRRLEKAPWSDLPSLRGPVERQFLRPLYLGESIAPFRLLDPALAVIPWGTSGGLFHAADAASAGFPHLAAWLGRAERDWSTQGRNQMSLLDRWDYNRELSSQFPIAPIRVVYSKAGTLPAAAILTDQDAIVDHKLYWAAMDLDEARYLEAILNAETARALVADRQSRGQWGARDFDKVMLDLPIPKFDSSTNLHREIVQAAREAEEVARDTVVSESRRFVAARGAIRDQVTRAGLAARMNALVAELLTVDEAGLRAAENLAAYGASRP